MILEIRLGIRLLMEELHAGHIFTMTNLCRSPFGAARQRMTDTCQ